MRHFEVWQIAWLLVGAARWTVLLSLVAFLGGGALGIAVTVLRVAPSKVANRIAIGFINLVQATPLLMLLFLIFFGLPLAGIDIDAWLAAAVALILFTSAFLADIWRGSIQAIPVGQWEAGRSLGLGFLKLMRLVVLPQAVRLSLPSTVGFGVQVVKGTALTSIIGFVELTKAGTALNNVTFRPFLVFAIVSAIYFALCFPLSWWSRRLERRLT